MPAITWDQKLEVGIEVVDKQHRRWIGLFNDLIAALEAGNEEKVVRETVESLLEYTNYHFKTEEALMERAGYDEVELGFHRREHRVFTDQIVIFRDRLAYGFQKVTPEVVDYMRGWLVTHVTATDRGYITSIQDAGIA